MSDVENNYQEQIAARISSSEKGAVFITSDFADLADIDAVNQALSRLQKKKLIRRVLRGVYELPKYSELLNEYVAPSPDKVAQALARNYGWTIVPCGDTALNHFGLSTQVPATWTYVSDGPYKEYSYDKVELRFKRTTNKDISKVSYKTALLIQAIKAAGKEKADDKLIKQITKMLSTDEKDAILLEAKYTTTWIYSIIKRICNGRENQ